MAGRFEGPVGHERPDDDETITVYHTTNAENAARLQRDGTLGQKPTKEASRVTSEVVARALGKQVGDPLDFEPGRGMGKGLYVTRHPASAGLYGDSTLPVRVKMRDLAAPPERPRLDAWRALNVDDGYIPGVLHPMQFGEVYKREDWREWNNQWG